MAKHRSTRRSSIYTPLKPVLSFSDTTESELDQTVWPDLRHQTIDQSKLGDGTTDQIKEGEYTAPVSFPDREDLRLKLVDASLVYKLEEYRSDLSTFSAAFWAIIGAILGIIINWFTNDPIYISVSSIIILFIFILFGILMFVFMNNYSKRAKEVKKKIQ